jgi:hypothetical protein
VNGLGMTWLCLFIREMVMNMKHARQQKIKKSLEKRESLTRQQQAHSVSNEYAQTCYHVHALKWYFPCMWIGPSSPAVASSVARYAGAKWELARFSTVYSATPTPSFNPTIPLSLCGEETSWWQRRLETHCEKEWEEVRLGKEKLFSHNATRPSWQLLWISSVNRRKYMLRRNLCELKEAMERFSKISSTWTNVWIPSCKTSYFA